MNTDHIIRQSLGKALKQIVNMYKNAQGNNVSVYTALHCALCELQDAKVVKYDHEKHIWIVLVD